MISATAAVRAGISWTDHEIAIDNAAAVGALTQSEHQHLIQDLPSEFEWLIAQRNAGLPGVAVDACRDPVVAYVGWISAPDVSAGKITQTLLSDASGSYTTTPARIELIGKKIQRRLDGTCESECIERDWDLIIDWTIDAIVASLRRDQYETLTEAMLAFGFDRVPSRNISIRKQINQQIKGQ